jgi:hypothetical protein
VTSLQIATSLLILAAGIAMVAAARALAASNYPPRAEYAAFASDNSTDSPLVAECEGTCAGSTEHEDDGDGTATCPGCGTPRHSPAPHSV